MMGDLGDEYIQITVTSPHKVGDGMSSFMAYTIKTTTNLSYFKVLFIFIPPKRCEEITILMLCKHKSESKIYIVYCRRRIWL